MAANVWKILVQVGDELEPDAEIAILESMKMEIPVVTEVRGTVTEVRVSEGSSVDEGDVIAVME